MCGLGGPGGGGWLPGGGGGKGRLASSEGGGGGPFDICDHMMVLDCFCSLLQSNQGDNTNQINEQNEVTNFKGTRKNRQVARVLELASLVDQDLGH